MHLRKFINQLKVPIKKWCHTIQMNNERQVYILPLANYNVYWPINGNLYFMASFFIRHYKLLIYHLINIFFSKNVRNKNPKCATYSHFLVANNFSLYIKYHSLCVCVCVCVCLYVCECVCFYVCSKFWLQKI